uniref:Uncharacterized protein n=1 Tax=Arundo donax TaxID=35708 RepID=A0A0A9GU45_ARUDO
MPATNHVEMHQITTQNLFNVYNSPSSSKQNRTRKNHLQYLSLLTQKRLCEP